MARRSKLDDPDARSAVLYSVGRGGHLTDAAKAVGVASRTLERYLAGHADFAREVEAARGQGVVLAHHAPTMVSRGEIPAPPDGGDDLDRAWFITQLKAHVEDPQSRGCAKSIDVLAQLLFAPELLAMKAEAKQLEQVTTEQVRPVVIRDPRPASRVIDAEIVPDIA